MITKITNWFLAGLLVSVLWHADAQARQGSGSGHQSSHSGLLGNSEADAYGQGAPLDTDTSTNGSFPLLMAVFPVIKAHVTQQTPREMSVH